MNFKKIKEEYVENLCTTDKRSPDYRDDYKCNGSCDECFYGRDKMAKQILDLLSYIEDVDTYSEIANDDIKNW